MDLMVRDAIDASHHQNPTSREKLLVSPHTEADSERNEYLCSMYLCVLECCMLCVCQIGAISYWREIRCRDVGTVLFLRVCQLPHQEQQGILPCEYAQANIAAHAGLESCQTRGRQGEEARKWEGFQ